MDAEKSHEPTQHRRQHARAQGHVARSQDLVSAAILLGGFAAIWSMGGALVTTMSLVAQRHLGGEPWLMTDMPTISAHGRELAWALAGCLLPIFGCVLAVAVAANVAQTGLLFLPGKLAADLSRIDPMKGLARIFSLAAAARLSFGVLKLLLVATVAYGCLAGERERLLGLPGMELSQIGAYLAELLLWTGMKVAFVLLLLALVDYGFLRWRHEHDLRMTTPEVREEMTNLQGNPQIAARRRLAQRQRPLGTFLPAVPKADVVITGPSGPAIAIRYDSESMTAPVVVAKGAGALADRIRQVAQDGGVAIVESPQLANELYHQADVNGPIPQAHYAAIAEILARTYRARS